MYFHGDILIYFLLHCCICHGCQFCQKWMFPAMPQIFCVSVINWPKYTQKLLETGSLLFHIQVDIRESWSSLHLMDFQTLGLTTKWSPGVVQFTPNASWSEAHIQYFHGDTLSESCCATIKDFRGYSLVVVCQLSCQVAKPCSQRNSLTMIVQYDMMNTFFFLLPF